MAGANAFQNVTLDVSFKDHDKLDYEYNAVHPRSLAVVDGQKAAADWFALLFGLADFYIFCAFHFSSFLREEVNKRNEDFAIGNSSQKQRTRRLTQSREFVQKGER